MDVKAAKTGDCVTTLVIRPQSKTSSRFSAFVFALVITSLLLRLCFFNFESGDYRSFLSRWYDFIASHGPLHSFKDNFSDYPLLYLYLLAVATFLPIKKIFAIKLISVIFDYVAAWFAYRIVSLKYGDGYAALAAAGAVLFLPTTILNSSMWGQCDVIYTSALLACLWWTLQGRMVAAMIAYGFAICFKPQSFFLGPFLYGLLLSRRLSWRQLFLPALIWLLVPIPAFLLGKPIGMIFHNQIGKAFGKVAANPAITWETPALTCGAPSFYSWVPENQYSLFQLLGWILTAVTVTSLSVSMYLWREKSPSDSITPSAVGEVAGTRGATRRECLLMAALLSLLIAPFFLPGTHERYFFPCDILSVVYAFYFPRFWAVALWVECASFSSYLPYLFGVQPIPLVFATCIMGMAITCIAIHYMKRIQYYNSRPMEGG